MKFVVAQQEMLHVLHHLTSVLERQQTRDVLSNARVVVTEQGELTVSCANPTMTMVAKKQLEMVEEAGSASIPGLRLFDIFRRIPSDSKVYFETVGDMIEISFAGSKFTLNLMTGPNLDALDRQGSTPPEDHISVSIKVGLLRSLLHYTNPIMGSRDPRIYQMGTCFEITTNHFRTVSTVSNVLALATAQLKTDALDNSSEKLMRFLIPRKTVLQVTQMIAEVDGDKDVTLILGSNQLNLDVAPFSLTSTLLDVEYPDYTQVFPDDEDWSVVCSREELRLKLDQVEVVAVDASHRVNWEFNSNLLALRSVSTRNDKANSEVALDEAVEHRQLSLNGERIMRVLNTMRHEKLQMSGAKEGTGSNFVLRGVKTGSPSEDKEPIAGVDAAYLFAPMSER